MNATRIKDCLEIIQEVSQHAAPTILSVGAVDKKTGQVINDTLVIHDCPPCVVGCLKSAGFSLSMCQNMGGLVVDYLG